MSQQRFSYEQDCLTSTLCSIYRRTSNPSKKQSKGQSKTMRTRQSCLVCLCVHYNHAQTNNSFVYPYHPSSTASSPIRQTSAHHQANQPHTSPKQNNKNNGLRPLQTHSPPSTRPIHILPPTKKPPPRTPPPQAHQDRKRPSGRALPNGLSGAEKPDAYGTENCAAESGS